MTSMRNRVYVLSQALTRKKKRLVIVLIDVLLAPMCLLLAVMITYGDIWPAAQFERLGMMFTALAMTAAVSSHAFGLPNIKLKSYDSFGNAGLYPHVAAVGLAALAFSALPAYHLPLVTTLSYSLLLLLSTNASRMLLLRVYLWALRDGKRRTRVLIYGAGTTGLQLLAALKAHDSVKVVAFIDDDPGLDAQRVAGLRIHPARKVKMIARELDVSRVLMAIPSLAPPQQMRLARKLEAMGLEVQLLPSFAQLAGTEALSDTVTPLAPGAFLGREGLEGKLTDSQAYYAGRVVMVTGAGGSVGSELCRQLLGRHPRRLVLFDASEHALYQIERELRGLKKAAGIELVAVLGSVQNALSVRQALEQNGVEVVLHAAAYKHVPLVEANPIAGLVNNVLGTRTLAEACVQHGVKRFLLISTDKAVRPTNVMGASKRIAELVVHDMAQRHPATRFCMVRFGNVLGSSGSVIPLFKEQIKRGGPVTVTHRDITRYFMTLPEAAQLVLLAGSFQDAASRGRAEVMVLDMGKPKRIHDLAVELIHAAGYTLRDADHPEGDIEISITGLRPGEKLHEELLIDDDMLATPHPKILRADEHGLPIASALQQLISLARDGDGEGARALALRVALRTEAESRPVDDMAVPRRSELPVTTAAKAAVVNH